MKGLFMITVMLIACVSTVHCSCSSPELHPERHYFRNHYLCIYECTSSHIMSMSDINLPRNGDDICKVSYFNSHIPKLSSDIIRAFGKLGILTINGSYINTIETETFSSSTYLLELNLPYNNLTTLSSDTFREQKNLTTLDLSHNHIQNISKELLRNTLALTQLNLNNNALVLLEPDNFDGLVNLLYLNLSWNSIGEIPQAHFGHQKQLLSLDLSHNRIAYMDIKSFIGLTSLNELYLNGNKIKLLQTNIFANVQNLRILDVSENVIEYIDAKELKETTQLSQISFHTNKLRCSIVSGLLKIFRSLHVNVASGPENELLSIHGINCNDTQDIFTTNITETKSIDALEVFFAKDFKKSEFYKFFSTFNGSSNSVDEKEIKRIVNDFVGIEDTHMVTDHKLHVELIGKLFSIQMWLGSLFMILVVLIASMWIIVYVNRNISVVRHNNLQLIDESESNV